MKRSKYNKLEGEDGGVAQYEQKRSVTILKFFLYVLLASIVIAGTIVPLAIIFGGSTRISAAITPIGLLTHLVRLNEIAKENNGNRSPFGTGYNASVDYVLKVLPDSYYDIEELPFHINTYDVLADATLSLNTQAGPEVFALGIDFAQPTYSGSVKLEGSPVVHIVGDGCTPLGQQFDEGTTLLIERGNCDFKVKVRNAQDAKGVVAVLIYDDRPGDADRIDIGEQDYTIGVLYLSQVIGQQIVLTTDPTVDIEIQGKFGVTTTMNVCATSKGGNAESIIISGAHLDSVIEGPGINDDGSGSVCMLEIAKHAADLIKSPVNMFRFCWWGAEELGLLGSTHYVKDQLTPKQLSQVKVYLNGDMLGTRNYITSTFTCNDNTTGINNDACASSRAITQMFENYFNETKLPFGYGAFSDRASSDWGPFLLDAKIPSGGLFTGASSKKTPAQRTKFGGIANAPYDNCYHKECDDIDNVDITILTTMTKGMSSVLEDLIMDADLENTLKPQNDIRLNPNVQYVEQKRNKRSRD